MSTTYTYKSISNLSDVTNINQNDILLISQVENNQLISKKTTINKIVSDVVQPLINNKCSNYLPLSAGQYNTINGTIYSSNTDAAIRHNDRNSAMKIVAGPYTDDQQNSWLPAELVLHHSGKNDNNKSRFELNVHKLSGENNQIYTTSLCGNCDGSLTWDTKNIVRSINDIDATIDGNCNISISDIPNLCTELNNRPLSTGLIDKANQLNTARKIQLTGDATGYSKFNGSTDISINVNVLSSDYAQKSLSAATSDKLKTARNIKLSGDLSGSFSFDGGSNITATVNVNNNSHNHTITNITNLQLSLDNKYDSTDFVVKTNQLSNNTIDNKNIPTCKAVVDWCNTNFLKSVGFDDPTAAINMLNSMLNEEDLSIYVDCENGDDDNDGTLSSTPVQTINRAIAIANGRRFIKESKCYIKLMDDIYFDTLFHQCTKAGTRISNSRIIFYHPDLVQTKAYVIESINSQSPITIYGPSNIMALEGSHMRAMISSCHTTFRYIKFDFNVKFNFLASSSFNINGTLTPGYESKYPFYVLYNNSNEHMDVMNCVFEKCYTALYNPTSISDVEFNKCVYCIHVYNTFCRIDPKLVINNGYVGIKSSGNGIISIVTDRPNKISIAANQIFLVESNGIIICYPIGSMFNIDKYWDYGADGFLNDSPNTNYDDVYFSLTKIVSSYNNDTQTVNTTYYQIKMDLDNTSNNDDITSKFFTYISTGGTIGEYKFYKNNMVAKYLDGIVYLYIKPHNIMKLLNYGSQQDDDLKTLNDTNIVEEYTIGP